MVVGSMIGSGVFLKAAGIAKILPHPGLILVCWLAAGLLTLSGALVIAELSARFPGSGGLYVFLRKGFGPRVAFLFGWSLLAILQSGSIASLACGVAKNVAEQCDWMTPTQQNWLAYSCIASLTILHCISVSAGARWLQNVVTSIKYAGLLGLVAMVFFGGHADTANLEPVGELPSGPLLFSAMGVVMLKTLWAYDGWANATFIGGEVREPEKNLPRALIGGTISVIFIYLAINFSYHLVMPPAEMAQSKSVAVSVARICMGSQVSTAVAALLAFSMFGTLNSSILSAPRVYYAMAQKGQFPGFMGAIGRFHTPYLALVLQGMWAVALIVIWKDFETITDNVVFVYWIFYALSVASALKFAPPTEGYRAPMRGLLVGVFVTGAIMLVVSQIIQAPQASAQALIILIPGLILSYWYGNAEAEDTESD